MQKFRIVLAFFLRYMHVGRNSIDKFKERYFKVQNFEGRLCADVESPFDDDSKVNKIG